MKTNIKNIKTVLRYFKEYKFKILLYSLILIIIIISSSILGYLMGRAIEEVTKGNINYSILLLIINLVIEIVSNVTINIIYYFFNKIQCIISRKIGYDVYIKTLKLPAVAFEEMTSGEIVNRVTNDTEAIVGSAQQLIEIFARIISSAIILVYIFFNSYIIGLEIVMFLILYSFVVKHYTKSIKELGEITKKYNDKFTSLTTESIRGVREIKTLGIINNLSKKMNVIVDSLTKSTINETKERTDYDNFAIVMCSLLEVGVFITCAILLGSGNVSLTFFIALTYYIYRYTWIIDSLTNFSKSMSKMLVSFNRIADIINNKLYDDVKYGNITLNKIKGVIEFKDVTFSYPNEGITLDKLNVKFEPNKKIAIVGASGEGKTTIFNLLTRIFDNKEGEILIDNVNIKDLTEESLRKNISIIRQEPFIFNLSIKDNFKILDERITLKEIRKYCSLASIDDYIMSLPKKYDTILGEGGVNLSGGQKQRIAIARTLLKKSKIILMDEATSSLDNVSQSIIKKTINELAKDHTVLIVAHRLSTIIDSDIIYVVEHGKIIDFGTHKELMKSCKFYQKLHTIEDKIV